MTNQSSSPSSTTTPAYTPPPELVAAAEAMLAEATSEDLAAAAALYMACGSATNYRSAVTGASLPVFDVCSPLVKAGWLAVARHSERRVDMPRRFFRKIVVLVGVASGKIEVQVVGIWTDAHQDEFVILSRETVEGQAWVSDVMESYEYWKDWAPPGAALVAVETSTSGAMLGGAIQSAAPGVPVLGVRGCWWCSTHLKCPAGCRRVDSPPPDKTVAIKVDTGDLQQRLDAFKSEVEALVNGADGRIDPFLMGISEIASATRDLAEAQRALIDSPTGPVGHLITDVATALHGRVRALASPPAEPTCEA